MDTEENVALIMNIFLGATAYHTNKKSEICISE